MGGPLNSIGDFC